MDAKRALEKVYAALGKKYGEQSVSVLSTRAAGSVRGVIPSGLEALDRHALGCGGWPWGRISEVYGPESSGKSSLVASSIGAVQRLGGLGILCDAEQAFTASMARTFGADPEAVLMLDPLKGLEEAGGMIIDTLRNLPADLPVFMALDSVPVLLTKAELEGDDVGDELPGIRARFYGRLCRYLVAELPKHKAHFCFVNQTRMKIGVLYGSPETTPGGNSIKFYATHRVRMSGGQVKDGHLTSYIKAIKNKVAEPRREVEARLVFDSGWDNDWTTLALAKEEKKVPKGLEATAANAMRARRELGWAPAMDAAEALGAPPTALMEMDAALAAAAEPNGDAPGKGRGKGKGGKAK